MRLCMRDHMDKFLRDLNSDENCLGKPSFIIAMVFCNIIAQKYYFYTSITYPAFDT